MQAQFIFQKEMDREELIPGGAGGLKKLRGNWKPTFKKAFIQTSFWIKYLQISLKDIKNTKTKYLLGLFSCFLVVLVIALFLVDYDQKDILMSNTPPLILPEMR